MEDFSTLIGHGSDSSEFPLSPIHPVFRQGVLTPRDYQLRCVDSIYDAWNEHNSVLAVLATGMGKTIVAAEVALRWPDELGKVLFLAHREELIDQAREKIGLHTGELPDVEMGQRYATLDSGLVADSRVVVGSVQTLVKPKRRSRFKPEDFGLVVIDECVTGDAIVPTDIGNVRLKDISTSDCRRVVSYNGEAITYSRILGWKDNGVRETVVVTFESGRTLRCTANHLLFTESGWVAAGQLKAGVDVLSLADVGAEPSLGRTSGAGSSDMFRGTRHTVGVDPAKTGSESSQSFTQTHHCASADVESRLFPRRKPSSHSWFTETDGTTDSSRVTTRDRLNGNSFSLLKKGRRFLGRCLGTQAFYTPISDQELRDCLLITERRSASGLNTNRGSFIGSVHTSGRWSAVGTETAPSQWQPGAFRVSSRSTHSSFVMGRSGSLVIGLMPLAGWDLRGGLATTAHHLEIVSVFTQKDMSDPRWNSSLIGSKESTETPRFTRQGGTTNSTSRQMQGEHSCHVSNRMSPSACSTSSDRVVSVESGKPERVYDIAVEGTHCFFANGVLVHNCHHAAAKSYLTILEHFKQNPRHRILGITATPKRHDKVGMHNVFSHCCFELDIRAGIDAGWLVGVQQKFITVEGLDFTLIRKTAGDLNMGDLAKAVMGGNAELTPAEREDLEKQEEMVHRFVDPTVREAQGRPTVVFCVTKEHARKSAEIFRRHPGITAECVTDETPTDERKAIIGRFKGGHTQVLCGCTVFTEGFDAPETSVVAIFRPTKSEALYRQMIGRGTRPLSGLVDRYLDPGDRREAISTSRKPSMTVLDFVGASGQHNLISSFDVLAGEAVPDDVKDAIREAIKGGETVDVDAAIEQAKESREEQERQAEENARRMKEEEERRRREEAEAKKRADEEARRKQYEEAERLLRESERRRSQLLGHATYHKQDVDPFEGHGAPEQFQAKFRGGATDGQVSFLEKLGVTKEVAIRYSKEQAGVVITAMKARTGADFRVTFGKYVGKALKDVPDNYVQWLKSQDNPMDLAKRLIVEWKRMKGGDA